MPSPLPSPSPRAPEEENLRHRVKRELRKRAQGVRRTTPAEACLERSAGIIRQLESLAVIQRARSIALFWPIETKHEVDLRAFDEALRRRDVRVAYPAIDPGPDVAVADGPPPPPRMVFRFVGDVETMDERGYGFREPALASGDGQEVSGDLHELDVVIVPALALDPAGQRIGYGAGYYDRALAGTTVTKVGVAFDFQLVSEVPDTEGDVPVDWVVTDRRVLQVPAGNVTPEDPSCPS